MEAITTRFRSRMSPRRRGANSIFPECGCSFMACFSSLKHGGRLPRARFGKWQIRNLAVVREAGFAVFKSQMNDRFFALQLFARVARTGSFSLAGRELGLS